MDCSGPVVTAGFDALPARIALLASDGEIVYTNRSWQSFGSQQGLAENDGSVGTNYLDGCDASSDNDAAETAAGIRGVIDETNDSFEFEYPCTTPTGKQWFMMQATPYTHDGDRYVAVMHVDITERRTFEQQARRQANQMEAFATLVSHDLRNPLSVAMAEAEMLAIDGALDQSDADENETMLLSSLERMETIIDDALVLARMDEVAVADQELLPLSGGVETAWSNVSTDDATVTVTDSIGIRAEPTLLDHLFENLFRNCMEHAGTAPAVTVGTIDSRDSQPLDCSSEDMETRNRTDGTCRVAPSVADETETAESGGFSVADDGPGIPVDERDRIFESGHTTDENGTGFGLAIVQRIADAHGWTVAVTESEAGGARFEFRNVTTVRTEPPEL